MMMFTRIERLNESCDLLSVLMADSFFSDEAKGAGRGGIEQEEVSFNNFNRDRVQTWIDDSVPKSKLSQSMLHLNLIGKNKALEKLEALSNLTKDEKRNLRARRTSDVNRYLTQFYALNDNSLKISKAFTNIHDVNKPHKENTNPLWKFLEKNLGLNSFASSGFLTTVSTTSSNLHVKSITDFDSDSLNEGRSEVSEISGTDGKFYGIGQIQSELDDETLVQDTTKIEVVKIEMQELDDKLDVTEADASPNIGDNKAEQQVQLQQQINEMEIHATSPVKQLFVKSISVSTEGSRPVSPSNAESPENKVDDVESDASSGSWESVDEEGEDGDEVFDINLAANNEPKDVAILGKLILEEEDMQQPIKEVQQLPVTDITKSVNPIGAKPIGDATMAVTEEGHVEGSDEESEEEIMQMVETLLQKTEFLQEEEPTGPQKSINVMFTNRDSSISSKSPQSDQRNTNQVVEPNEDIEKEKEEFEEFDEALTYHILPGSEESNVANVDSNQPGVSANGNAEIEGPSDRIDIDWKNLVFTIEDEKETLESPPNGTDPMVEIAHPANPSEDEIQNVQEPRLLSDQENSGITLPNQGSPETMAGDGSIEGRAAVIEEAPEDDNGDEIFEDPPEILDNQFGVVNTLVDIGQTLANIVAAAPSEEQPTLGEVVQSAVVATPPTPDDESLAQNQEQAMVPAMVKADENSLKIPEATHGSSSGTPQTALNMVETDSKSLATNLLQNSEGNSERDVSPIPTDSDKDPEFKMIKERQRLSRAKSSYELSMGDKLFEDENKLQRTTSSHELVNLLKESLAKDDVVERIVSTLFQSVLRANDLGRPGRSSSMHMSRHGSSLSRDMSYMGSSPSEIDDSEFFYEAVEPREPIPERRSWRNFRKRGRNSRRRGTPRRFDDSSLMSTSTDNYSNRDEHSSSTPETPENLTETEVSPTFII